MQKIFPNHSRHRFRFFAVLMILAIVVGCSTNPATKRKELMLVSEDKEFGIGRQVDKTVREEMGIYLELPELRSAVKEIVDNLGQNSDRPTLIYRVEIIDTPDFNAFAVPGGFLYVHRGLLERINSMDDLAAVLGHEIAHVAARHSAAQISKMQLLNYGLFGLTVATGGATQNYGPLIDLGAALSFSKFSRDDEREADHFGTSYMAKSGYNPKAAIDVMEQIQRLQAQEPSTLDVWFMTHPPTNERIENLTEEINRLSSEDPQVLNRPHQRNRFIKLLDGMAVGQWNSKELVQGDRYYNKEFLFSIPIPPEWEVQINNKNATAVFFNTRQEAFAIIDIQPLQKKIGTESYFKDRTARLKSQGFIAAVHPKDTPKFPHDAMVGIFQTKQNTAQLIVFVNGNSGFSILGICPADKFHVISPQFDNMIQDFHFLTEEKALKLAPPRLRIHNVVSGDTWHQITATYFSDTNGKEKLAEYNGLSADTNPTPGTLLKIPPTLRFR